MSARPARRAAAALLALAAALTLAACGGSSDSKYFRFGSATPIGTVIPDQDRKPAADLQGALLTGSGKTALSERKGQVVVLPFWASWCGPCRVELPMLQGVHEQYRQQGVSFLGVDSRDTGGNGAAFLKANGITFPSIKDGNGDVAADLGNVPAALPFTVVVDKQGRVAAVYVQRYAAKDLERALTTLRAET